jgi:hypothetical protein
MALAEIRRMLAADGDERAEVLLQVLRRIRSAQRETRGLGDKASR